MPNGVVEIRRACLDDVDSIAEIVRSAYGIYVERIGSEPAPMLSNYRGLVDDGNVWVATNPDRLITGVLVLQNKGRWLLLENVAVRPASQGQGIGRRLVAFAEQMARDFGLAEIRLYTNRQMVENIRWYLQLGFQETGRLREDGFDRVYFRKPAM